MGAIPRDRNMPKKAQELSPLAVSRLAKPGYHFVGGVAGLVLQVLPSGGRSWVLRATVGTKRRDMSLGGFPDVTLADAREAARAARAKVRSGIDPIDEAQMARSMLKLAQSNAVSFERASLTYIETHEAGWRNVRHAQQWRNSLATHAYPVLGQVLVPDIELPQILAVLEPIWRIKIETATRVRGRIESVLDGATTKGYREGLNPARWKGHLCNLLPAAGKITEEKHFPALPVRDASAFILALRDETGTGARALEFGILTAARSGEIRGATWSEIDVDVAAWTIPAQRMKMKTAHRVPLSRAAVDLLAELPRVAGTDLLFVAPRGGELSDTTLNAVIKRMNEGNSDRWIDPKNGRGVVQHGFRSTFRDWAAEQTNYPNHVVEMALAHAIGDKVEAAYRRGDLFEKRSAMMSDWAAFLVTPQVSATVILMQSMRA